jgi:RNA recognition motif-containing protein
MDFQRARARFDRNDRGNERKRKPYDGDRDRDRSRDSRDRSRDYEGDRDGKHRRSRSPPRWERGKKQQKKTQTDVPPERELFVGNIPSSIDERFLLNFLNGAMRQSNLCPRHETPCLSCQVNSGNFAFVEMLNADVANKCLNLNGILFLNSRIKVGRPKKYAGPFVVSKTWQEMTGESLTVDAVLDSEQEKVNRELFVGNTTPEMTDQMLTDFLGTALEQVGLNVMEGNPITTCEMFGKYAFIEFRTPREASYALNLNNIPFMGSNLQVTRPSKWTGKWDKHGNWEHILAKHNLKPEEFQLGQVISPALIAATPTTVVEGENIGTVKAELAQVKRALEITRRQLDESTKKSEARKEQLVSLNKKWAEGKTELTERRSELGKMKDQMDKKKTVSQDIDTRMEAQELKRRHEETQGMLRGVTESLVKATEKLASERKIRKDLERLMQSGSSGLNLNLSNNGGMNLNMSSPSGLNIEVEEGEEPEMDTTEDHDMDGGDVVDDTPKAALTLSTDFAALRGELDTMKTDTMDDEPLTAPVGSMPPETPMATTGQNGEPQLDSLKEFLAKTPKTPIDWSSGRSSLGGASAGAAPDSTGRASIGETPRRDRAGVRLCRLLIHAPEINSKDASDIQAMAGKYNLGGYIKSGKPGLIIVEGLEFNCDIFMDNVERQKKTFKKAGKVSERSGRAFPMELSQLEGATAMDDFRKACESVKLMEALSTVVQE